MGVSAHERVGVPGRGQRDLAAQPVALDDDRTRVHVGERRGCADRRAARRASNAITPSTRTASRPSSGGAPNSRAPAVTSGGAGSIGAATGAAVVPSTRTAYSDTAPSAAAAASVATTATGSARDATVWSSVSGFMAIGRFGRRFPFFDATVNPR
ncbi:hypothetical protein WJ24_00415 [Burkholderia vietnamiensis]|nr:hypothetical protein WJ24_00415 [Burkholderia vietnamiensis]